MKNTTGKILAVGAGGPTASLVLPELLKRGADVRGFLHKAEDAKVTTSLGISDVIVGDLSEAETVRKALIGIERAFYIAPAALADEAKTGVQFVALAKESGVRRVVFSSVIDPVLSVLENHRAKAPVEEALIASGLEYVLLQPGLFFQNLAPAWPRVKQSGVFAEPYSLESRFSRVDYRDVAELAAVGLTEDRLLFGTFELVAEGSTNRYDVAAVMSEVLGRPVQAVRAEIPEGANLPAKLTRMFDWYDKHSLVGNSAVLRALLGREPRTLKAFLKEVNSKS